MEMVFCAHFYKLFGVFFFHLFKDQQEKINLISGYHYSKEK